MARAKLREMGDAMHEAIVLFKEKQVQLPYSSIVVDEAHLPRWQGEGRANGAAAA